MADDLDKENQETDFGFDGGDEFNDFNKQQSLAHTIQSNPVLKIGIIAAAFVFIVGGFLLFGGGSTEDKGDKSSIEATGGDVREAPTSSEVTDVYKDAIDQFNEAGLEEANQTQQSFIPVPVGPATNTGIVVPEVEEVQEDPLERWRLLQEERARQQQDQVTAAKTEALQAGELSPQEQKRQEVVQKLSQSMLGSMQQLTGFSNVRKMQINNVTDDKTYYEDLIDDQNQREIRALERRKEFLEKKNELLEIDPELQAANANGAAVDDRFGPVIVSEGTIEYAQMLIQANSDIPGPVLAQIVTGPLAGSRIIGSFSIEDEYLVIEFKSVVIDGQSVSISAIAVDPDTNLTGVVTDVNHRYFKRLVLPVAAEFISGLAGAIAQTQTTTNVTGAVVVIDNQDLSLEEEIASGIETAGDRVSEFVDEEASRTKIQVKVAAGTPIGILFTEPLKGSEVPPTATLNTGAY